MSTVSSSTTSTTAYKVTADTTGTLVLQTGSTPTTAVTIDGSQNVTFAKGFTVGATAAPAFSVSSTALVSSAASTFTKITYDTEDFDTNSNFASSRFTPTVAGYYQVNAAINNGTGTQTVSTIYKNGSEFKTGTNFAAYTAVASATIYMNGSTDYLEFYVYTSNTSNTSGGIGNTVFQGCLIRTA